jgi:signal transduction histidine kinase
MSGEQTELPDDARAGARSTRGNEAVPPSQTPVGRTRTEPIQSARIMIVDDEPICVKAAQKYLRDAGYKRFITTTDSTQAVAMMLREPPDLLILDYVMPNVDGIEILKQRLEDDSLRHIPVLVLTASKEANIKTRALELAATDFLSKPIEPDELLPRVRNALISKRHRDQLAQVNVLLEDRVRMQTDALRVAWQELKVLDNLKNEFLTLVSHELRTPVAGIYAVLELLARDVFENAAERTDVLRMASDQARRLERIIKDVERFLDLTAGRIPVTSENVSLNALLADVAAKWAPRAEAKGLAFRVAIDGPFSLQTDPFLLSGSLDRLLDNAVKFTERGEVCLSCRRNGESIVLEVQDTGCGIEEQYKGRVLSHLTVAAKLDNHQEGRGLGLSILERQMTLLGGTVEFESPGKDRGSTFRLILRER